MALSLESISAQQKIKAPRMILMGPPKIGKTAFAVGARYEGSRLVESGLNGPIVFPIKGEEGIDAYPVPAFPTLTTYDEVLEGIAVLADGDHEYRTVVIDSLSALAPIIEDDVCKEFGVDNVRKVPGFKTGEAGVRVRWRRFLDSLSYLRDERGMAIILISHLRVRKALNQDTDAFDAFDLNVETDIAELLKQWADATFFASMKLTIKKEGEDTKFSKAKRKGVDLSGGQRYLFTQPRPAHPTGGRGVYGELPAEIPLDWSAFEAAVAAVAG
jgi:hypothetical protein